MATIPDKSPDVPSPLFTMFASSMTQLHEEFRKIEAADTVRNEFIKKLIQQVGAVTRERDELTKQLRAKEMLASTYQDRYEAAEEHGRKLQNDMNCDNFILVLVDGDDTLFKDEYIVDGIQGGERAARDLQQALFDFLKGKRYFKNDYKIVVKIYLNLLSLSKTYRAGDVTSTDTTFQQLVQGFNKTHPLMDITDAGNGKECADRKVQAEFQMFSRSVHCKQLILAGSGDNGYGGLLRPFVQNDVKSEKITLIEALPFVQELQQLSNNFESVKFDHIFRDTKIVTTRVSFHEDANRVRTPSLHSTSAAPHLHTTTATTYAAKATNGVSANPTSNGNSYTIVTASSKSTPIPKQGSKVYVNEFGQRVDVPLKGINVNALHRIKARKLCNKHYLGGYCPYGTDCVHPHKDKLSDMELLHLRQVARLKPCIAELQCRDPECLDGHRCMRGTECPHWKDAGTCRFSDEMHEVDISKMIPAAA